MSIPPLPPFTIFIYLLSPYLKLGALLLPHYQLPLKHGLSGLLISAALAVVARHLLYLLARYLRKADLEDVVGGTFVSTKKRGRKGERRRDCLKFLVRFGTAVLRILLAVVYVHECAHFILHLFGTVNAQHHSSSELGLAMVAVVIVLLLSYPGSLSSRLVVYTTNVSVFTYLLWLASITYLYTQGTLPINSERLESKNIWNGLVTTAFIFTSSNTLPLYASTKGTIQQLLFDADTALALPGTTPSTGNTSRRDGNDKQPLYRSFKFLSLLSVGLAVGLTLPLVGFAAYPNESPRAPAKVTGSSGYPEQYPDWGFPRPSGDSSPATRIQTYITPALASLTLLFGVPQLLITIPTFPAGSFKWLRGGHRHASTPEPLSRLFLIFKKSLVSLSLIILTFTTTPFKFSTTVWSLTATLAILATYYVPAILHILAHTFKSPLSIILPSTYFSSSLSATTTPRTSFMNLPTPGPSGGLGVGTSTPSSDGNNEFQSSTSARPQPITIPSSSRHRHSNSQVEHDDLLQRKERALQKRQMRRRIIWDIWAWAIFFGGFVVLGVRARMS